MIIKSHHDKNRQSKRKHWDSRVTSWASFRCLSSWYVWKEWNAFPNRLFVEDSDSSLSLFPQASETRITRSPLVLLNFSAEKVVSLTGRSAWEFMEFCRHTLINYLYRLLIYMQRMCVARGVFVDLIDYCFERWTESVDGVVKLEIALATKNQNWNDNCVVSLERKCPRRSSLIYSVDDKKLYCHSKHYFLILSIFDRSRK